MRKDNSEFKTKFISEAGSYLINADYFAFVELQDYACYCIADGIDDDKKRKSAEIAVSAVIDSFYSKSGMSKVLMKRYASVAHKQLLKETRDIRLEASILIVVTDYKKMRWVNVGNSRLYHLRNDKIINHSKDQSLSQNMAEEGEIPLDMIAEHEERHNLYCYLGMPGKFKPYVSPKIKLEDGDSIILCTRGIWENIGAPEILDATEEATEPEAFCINIEDIILSQRMKWISNYTVACIYVNKVYKNPKKERIVKRILMLCIPFVMILIILGVTLTIRNVKKQNNIKQMWSQISEGYIDIEQNGKILEDTNALKQGAKSYDEYQSSGDRELEKVKAAKPYIEAYHILQDIQELEKANEISYMELYKEYARLLGIAKGKKYIADKLETMEMDAEAYDVAISSSVDEAYLNEEAKESFEKIIENYDNNFNFVMLNAAVENTYNETDSQYDTVVESDLTEYVRSAKKNAVYNFQNDKILSKNILYLENQLQKYKDTDKLDKNLYLKVDTLLDKLSEFKNRIVGDAWVEKANDAKKNGKYQEALKDLEKAQGAYKKAGTVGTDKASSCKDASENIEKQVEQKEEEKTENEALELYEAADSLFESGYYEEAMSKYKSARKKYMKLKDNSASEDCKEMINNCKYIINANQYKEQADDARKAKKYESAKSYYELAKQSYYEAGDNDNVTKMQTSIDKMDEKIEKEARKKKQKNSK